VQGSTEQAVVEAGTDGKCNPSTECYRCKHMGHIASFCPTKAAKAAAKANVASSSTDPNPGAEMEPTANSAQSYSIEVDDEWEDAGEEAVVYTTDAETLDLLSRNPASHL
jgi:hypothetical protein